MTDLKNANSESKSGKAKGLIAAFAALIISYALFKAIGAVFDRMDNDFLSGLLKEIVFAGGAFVSVLLLHMTWIYKSDRRLLKKGWSAIAILLIPMLMSLQTALVNLLDGDAGISALNLIFFIIHMLLIGYAEEVLFRGVLQNAFHRLFGEDSTLKVVAGVVCASFVFGAMHLGHLFDPEVSTGAAIAQAVMTCGYGMIFGSAYYRTGRNIWYVAIIHAINDAIGFVASGRFNGMSTSAVIGTTGQGVDISALLVAFVVFLLITIFLLRPKKLDQIKEIQNS